MNDLTTNPTVVVADDDLGNRHLITTLLGYRHYRVLEAGDGVEALELVGRERPQLLISDLLMPRMDGFELVRQIRADERLTGTPVIFYTASYHSDDARRLAKACGVQALIYKPVEPEAVYAAVDAALANPAHRRFDKKRFASLNDVVAKGKVFEQSRRLRAARERLADLASLGQALATDLEPVAIIKMFCSRAREILLAREVAVALTEASGETLQLAVRCDKDGQLQVRAGTEPLSKDLQRLRVFKARVLGATDTARVCRTLRLDAPPASLVAIPISAGTSHYGWIAVSRLGGAEKGEFEESTLETMAAQLAVSFERSRKTAELREQAESLQASEHARETAEGSFRELFEAVMDGLIQVSPSGHLLRANSAFARLLGYDSASELIGRRADEFYCDPEDRTRMMSRLMVHGDIRNFETEVQHRDGTRRHVLLSSRLVASAGGVPLYHESSVRDVTDIKTAELALRRAHERKQFALRAAQSCVWEWDVKTGRMVWNDTVAEVFGVAPEAAPATIEEFQNFIHPDDRARVGAAVANWQSSDIIEAEYRIVRPDGTERWIAGTGRLSHEHSKDAPVFIGVAVDITGRKALEDQFRQAQKMEAIGLLAGGVAHDFNNLITAILGFTELASESVDAGSLVRRDLAQIKNAGQRAAALTRQLLAFSRRQVLEVAVADINELVSTIEPMLARLLGERIHIRLNLADDGHCVRVDAGQIEQVLMNLAVNARDAMPDGGTLVIKTTSIDLDQEYVQHHPDAHMGRHIVIAVSDTGIGMDTATQRRVFEPFFTTKPVGKGTGLGLSTVFGIVQQSGGHIDVDSSPGAGTTFKVYLPVASGNAQAAIAPVEAPAIVPRGDETVLLAEDERSVRLYTKVILERHGYRVLDAEDLPSAQALARGAGRIDLLLTDMMMPGGSGFDLFGRLAADRPHLSVLYMSGYTDAGIVDRGVLKADTAFLQKPFTSDLLLRKLRDVLDHDAARRGQGAA